MPLARTAPVTAAVPFQETKASRSIGGRPVLLALVGAGLAGAWLGQEALVLLAGTALAAIVVGRTWSRLSLRRLGYTRRLGRQRAFPGETIDLAMTVENAKVLPLPWIEWRETVPAALRPGEADNDGEAGGAASAALGWYSKATLTRRLVCRRRGIFRIGPATVTSGDPFGLFPRSRMWPASDRLVVYPRLFALGALGLPSRHPLGDTRVANALFADPARTSGVRDYTPDVPLRHVHWKASARGHGLQARQFEATTRLRVMILLDAAGFAGRGDAAAFEHAVSTAASLAVALGDLGHPVGLLTNAAHVEAAGPTAIPPGGGPSHVAAVLEALAAATRQPTGPLDTLLASGETGLARGDTLAAVCGHVDAAAIARLHELRRRGIAVQAFLVGDAPGTGLDLPVRRIPLPQPAPEDRAA